MRVQLKQTEIIAALALYLGSIGVNTTDKDLSVEFTSGRKENGLTADINIEAKDSAIPGFTDVASNADVTVGGELRAVATSDPAVPAQAAKVAESAATEIKPETNGNPTEVTVNTADAGGVKSAGSLFGG